MRNHPMPATTDGADSGLPHDTTRGQRTDADFSSLLLELARAQRGFGFFGETDGRRQPLADRAHRALISELDRAGPIEFILDDSAFRIAGGKTSVAADGALSGLHAAFRGQGLRRLRFDPALTNTALAGLFDLVGRGADRFPSAEYLAHALAARDTRGIRLNEIAPPDVHRTPKLDETSPRVSASLGLTHTLDEAHPPRSADGKAQADEPDEPTEKPSLDADPLRADAVSRHGERMRARLIELDATVEDDAYRTRITDVTTWAEDLWDSGQPDECYRAMLVLAAHSTGQGGRTGAQARAALTSLAALASGARLQCLIDRASHAPAPSDTTVRAAQMLLLLGERALPAILDRLRDEDDADRAARLRGLVLTQGEKALPQLLEAIHGRDERKARLGIRLVGEIQNPVVLPLLLETLEVPDLGRRLETIRALSLLPGEASKTALTNALASDLEAIASAASEALATCDGQDAVPTLLDVLEASLHSPRTELGRTLVDLLGRLGDERAVPRLCSILEKRPMIRRAHWHAIQLATIDALAVLPTREARRSIERASLHAPRPIRDHARAVLDRTAD